MNISAIIAEFNPFHNGHLFLLDTVRSAGADCIICVISGSLVQRGDVSVIPKHERVKTALLCGADLVIELPAPYSCSPAQFFSKSSVSIVHSLGVVDSLYFGSESADMNLLYSAASAMLTDEYAERIRDKMKTAVSYPTAQAEVLSELSINSHANGISNDILATEYIKALIELGSNIKPVAIRRIDKDNSDSVNITSASELRRMIFSSGVNSVKPFVPPQSFDVLDNCIRRGVAPACISMAERYVIAKLRGMSTDELVRYPDVTEGIEYKIKKSAASATDFDSLVHGIKSKRYTMSRIHRTVVNIDDTHRQISPPYIRVLGFNNIGRTVLSDIKKRCSLPLETSSATLCKLSADISKIATAEQRATDLYSICTTNILPAGLDYTTPTVVIKD